MPKDKGAKGEVFSPGISETRSKSFSNPTKAFKQRRASSKATATVKAETSQPTETDTADRTLLVPQADETPVSATSSYEQDSFISMMRATRDMSPEEVKAYLTQRAQTDHEKHKNDVSGVSDGEI